jgi:hypothetical protein
MRAHQLARASCFLDQSIQARYRIQRSGPDPKRKRMNITNQIYMGAEAAMSNALAGVSRPNGVKKLFIVLCAPLLLVVLFYGRHYVF